MEGPLACCPALFVLWGAIFHTYNVFTAGCLVSFGAFVNMHVPNHRPGPQAGNSHPCLYPPASLRRVPHQFCTHHLVSLGGQLSRRRVPPWITTREDLFWASLRWTFPWGLELFQTKTYTRETVWQYVPPFKAGGESQGCTSRLG